MFDSFLAPNFSYVEEFPGLVHFVFVDRMTHQMTAPSLNISEDDVDRITAYVKEQVQNFKAVLFLPLFNFCQSVAVLWCAINNKLV